MKREVTLTDVDNVCSEMSRIMYDNGIRSIQRFDHSDIAGAYSYKYFDRNGKPIHLNWREMYDKLRSKLQTEPLGTKNWEALRQRFRYRAKQGDAATSKTRILNEKVNEMLSNYEDVELESVLRPTGLGSQVEILSQLAQEEMMMEGGEAGGAGGEAMDFDDGMGHMDSYDMGDAGTFYALQAKSGVGDRRGRRKSKRIRKRRFKKSSRKSKRKSIRKSRKSRKSRRKY